MPRGAECRARPRGVTRLRALLFLVVLIAIGYLAATLGPPYWTYFSMFDPVKEASLAATLPDGEQRARETLAYKARELGIELGEDGVSVDSTPDGEAVVRVAWSVPVNLLWYRHTLRFDIERRSR